MWTCASRATWPVRSQARFGTKVRKKAQVSRQLGLLGHLDGLETVADVHLFEQL
jgi:hypothetical protein